MDLELIKEYRDVNFVYRVPSVNDVTLALVDGGKWPEKAKALLFQPDTTKENDYETLWRNIGDKYFSRAYYYARKEDIRVPDPEQGASAIKTHVFRSPEEMGEIYFRTIAEYFWKPWEKYVFGYYGKENSEKIISEQARTMLSYDRVLAHEKDGRTVSFLAYKPINDHLSGREVDWILWVWIDPAISGIERQKVRSEFAAFLRNSAGTDWVAAATEPFNPRPNVFWQKLGFKLKCVGLTIKK